jgi:hypothetical protein
MTEKIVEKVTVSKAHILALVFLATLGIYALAQLWLVGYELGVLINTFAIYLCLAALAWKSKYSLHVILGFIWIPGILLAILLLG